MIGSYGESQMMHQLYLTPHRDPEMKMIIKIKAIYITKYLFMQNVMNNVEKINSPSMK